MAALGAILTLFVACAPEGYDEDPLFSDPGTLEVPPILPTSELLDGVPAVDPDAEPGADLQARGEALRQRADGLRRAP